MPLSRSAGLALALWFVAAWGLGRAAASDTQYELDIERQEVRGALTALAQQTHSQLFFAYDVAADVQGNAVHGRHTLDAALAALLAGTGLHGTVTSRGVITVAPSRDPADAGPGRGAGSAAPGGPADGAARPRDVPDSKPKTLEEITVTAERRSENPQHLPLAITAFTGEELSNRGVEGLATLQQVALSVQLGFEEGSFAKISIRGVGNDLLGTDVEPAVAVIQDGVPYASQWVNAIQFLDTERVEVLRGPQGTISGRNATGGAVLIHSKAPTDEFDAGVQTTLGDRDRLATESYVSGPLGSGDILGRLAVRTDRADGWVQNRLLDQTLGSIDILQARGTLLARLPGGFSARLTVEGLRDRSSVFFVDYGRVRPDTPTLSQYYGLPGFDPASKTLEQDEPSRSDVERTQVTLALDGDVAGVAHLAAVSGYLGSRVSLATDLDATAAPAILDAAPTPLIHIGQWSQELTLTADVGRHADVIAGVLFLRQGVHNLTIFGAPLVGVPAGGYHYDEGLTLDSWGAYSQWRYRPTDHWCLSAGVRHIADTKVSDEHDVILGVAEPERNKGSWNAWTPRLALDYTPVERLTTYVSISQGYKSGGFDSLSVPVRTFKAESVRNYEAGLKAAWLDERLKTTLTGFYMAYRDIQETGLGITPNAFGVDVTNIPNAGIGGTEVEVEGLIAQRLLVTVAGTHLDARYGTLRAHDPLYPTLGVPDASGLTLRDISGNQLVRAPKWQGNVSARYSLPLSARLNAELTASAAWQDRTYFDYFNHPGTSQGAFALLNLRAELSSADERWRAAAFVDNATDRFYLTAKPIQPTGPVPIGIGHPGLPRTLGLSLAYRF